MTIKLAVRSKHTLCRHRYRDGSKYMERAFSKKKDIWREQNTDIRRCDHLNNQGKGDIVSEKVILFFIGYDLGMVWG